MKLKTKISLIMLIVVLISFAILTVVGTRNMINNYRPLKASEVNESMSGNIETIESLTRSMEQKASDLAIAGGAFYEIAQHNLLTGMDNLVMDYLLEAFSVFPEALGGGVWFEPYTIDKDKKYFGPYVYWDSGKVLSTWDLNTEEYDYHSQEWFTFALPANWDRNVMRDKEYYWSAPYIDEAGSGALMITVDAFMYNHKKEIIGVSTIDWAMQDMLETIKSIKITDNSNSFLVEINSNTILVYTPDDKMSMKSINEIDWLINVSNSAEPGKILELSTELYGQKQMVYFTRTESGMVFGQIIPETDLTKAINKTTFSFAIFAVGLLILLIIILYLFIAHFTKELSTTSLLIKEIAQGEGDLTNKLHVNSNDEVGELAESINQFLHNMKQIIVNIKSATKITIKAKESLSSTAEQTSAAVVEISANVKGVKNQFTTLDESIFSTS
ncbi:MAG: HAMP domain-containing protein, partial [Spirochaetota bacterium]|nr:HAMP domain-containing protein [Spirochaetota bacterium]